MVGILVWYPSERVTGSADQMDAVIITLRRTLAVSAAVPVEPGLLWLLMRSPRQWTPHPASAWEPPPWLEHLVLGHSLPPLALAQVLDFLVSNSVDHKALTLSPPESVPLVHIHQ